MGTGQGEPCTQELKAKGRGWDGSESWRWKNKSLDVSYLQFYNFVLIGEPCNISELRKNGHSEEYC